MKKRKNKRKTKTVNVHKQIKLFAGILGVGAVTALTLSVRPKTEYPKSDFSLQTTGIAESSLFARSELETSGRASDTSSSENTTPKKERPFSIEIGGNYTHVNIKPNGLASFKGNLGGAQASFEYKPKNDFYGGILFDWKEGTTHRSGEKRSLLYIDVQERFGYTSFWQKADLSFTLFTGLGYRHFGQKLTTSDASSLEFRYNEFYIPVGTLTDYTVNSWFACGLGFTWMPQIYSTVEVVKGFRQSLNDTLSNFFVELPLSFTPTHNKRFRIVLNPFYERWTDGHTTGETSTDVTPALPGNAYNFWGADVNFSYSF